MTQSKSDLLKDQTGSIPEPPRGPDAPVLVTPLVLKSSKKKKKRYTQGTKSLQEFAQGVSDAAFRSTNSVARSAKSFSKRSKKAARKRRDGLVWDSVQNAVRSVGVGTTELGKAPDALAQGIRTGQIRKAVRRFVP